MDVINDNPMIQLQKAAMCQGKNKTLTAEQKKYVQAWANFNCVIEELNQFWYDALRNSDGAVDWKQLTEPELENFEQLNRLSRCYLGIMSRLEDSIFDMEKTLAVF